ncbi:MAG: hypothetical protein KatS3mg023_0600 [Armatimonadota bacterium]|nr:MAG: hypothetical protein KatS3mg023_0600 [Armatimonadota bacterium]
MSRKSQPSIQEYEPFIITGEAVGRGASLAVRVSPGEYVSVPAHLLPQDIREGDRIRIEVRVAIARHTQETEDDASADTR